MIDGSPASCKISLTIWWLWGLSSWRSNSNSTVLTLWSVRALHLPLTVPNITSSLWILASYNLCSEILLQTAELWTLYIHTDFKILSSLLNGIKVGAFAWYSVKICVIFGVRFESQKVDRKENLHENWNTQNSILEIFEHFCQISSKSILIISRLPFQSWVIFETKCTVY